MPAPLDPAVREAIENDIRAGLKRNEIARKHEVSGATVTNIGKKLEADGAGPAFDRSGTKRATEAREVDSAESRSRLRALLLADAHRLREQLWKPCTIHHFGGKDNTLASLDLDQPTFADQRQIMTTVGIAIDKIVRLDGGDQAEQQAASLIQSLVEDIRSRRTPAPDSEEDLDAAG